MPQASPFWICHECGAQMRPIEANGVPQCASCGSEFIEILDPDVNPDPRYELPHPPTRPGEYHSPPGPPPPIPERPPTGPVPAAPEEQGGILSSLFSSIFGGGGSSEQARTPDSPPRAAPSGSNITNTDNGRTWQFNFGGGTLRFQTYNGPAGYGHGTAGYGQQPPPFAPFGHPFLGGQYNGAGYNNAPGNANDGLDDFFAGAFGAPPPHQRGQMPPQMEGMDLLQGLLQMIAQENGSPFAGRNGQLGDYVMTEQGFNDVLERLMQATGPQGPLPASKTVIDGLPRFKLDEETLEKSTYKDCSVCMEDFKLGEEVVRVPCGHIFHPDCLVPWLEVNGSCPVCRFSLVPENGNRPAAAGPSTPAAEAAPAADADAHVTAPGGVFSTILNRLWGQSGAASAEGNPNNPSAQEAEAGATASAEGPSTSTGGGTSAAPQRADGDRRSTSPTVGGARPRPPGAVRRASGFGAAPASAFANLGRPPAAPAPVDLLTGDSLAAEHGADVLHADPPSPVAGASIKADPPSPIASADANADPPSPVLGGGALPPSELSSAIPDDYRAKHARREQEAHEREEREARERAAPQAPGGSRSTAGHHDTISPDDLD